MHSLKITFDVVLTKKKINMKRHKEARGEHTEEDNIYDLIASYFTASILLNLIPFSSNFILGNRKSHGARSGE